MALAHDAERNAKESRFSLSLKLTDSPHLVFQQAMVSLDLETTGLDAQRDAIIEVGAVKFQGREVLGTYTTLVNPFRPLSTFVQRLTGIGQEEVATAPSFSAVAVDLEAFVGDLPVVGHNVRFDLSFLMRSGLRLPGPPYDTQDLAIVLKAKGEYSLAALSREVGVINPRAHRALADAATTQGLFVALVERGLELDLSLLEEWYRLATQASWPLRHLLRTMVEQKRGTSAATVSALPIGGVDLEVIRKRMDALAGRPVGGRRPTGFGVEETAALLSPDGPVSAVLPGYEQRQEQVQMLRGVAGVLENGGQLLVEAGTGVGKSLAYLLPAALFAMERGQRVVVSTNTISLQEQLVTKDLPAVARIVAAVLGEGAQPLRFAQLKGRSNYLCTRRWMGMRASQTLTEEEARVLGKVLLWLQGTSTGDRGELRFGGRDAEVWDRLSASGAKGCPLPGAPCFRDASRKRAEDAYVVVVNHALLLADLVVGGGLIPEYDHLIVDEAHHLEAEATRQFGFIVSQDALDTHLETLGGTRGLAGLAAAAFTRAAADMPARRQAMERTAQRLVERAARARQEVNDLYAGLAAFAGAQSEATSGGQGRAVLRVTPGARTQRDWSRLEVAVEGASGSLQAVAASAAELSIALEGLSGSDVSQARGELDSQVEMNGEFVAHLEEFMVRPEKASVYWLEVDAAGNVKLSAAPLRVDTLLRNRLLDQKRTVVLTSATLSTAGSLAPMKALLGAADADELVLGSPFDYRRLALVCVPQDMPELNAPRYEEALANALVEVAKGAKGRTMVLFTSYSALRAASERVRGPLEAEEIAVLAQGTDGSAAQVLERFQANPKALLMGTASFWEGVDLVGEQLSALVLVRLPFAVPTDPVFAARSETYEDSFGQYAVPQAILKFRQGFGRLIRSSRDRGVVVVLDRRLISRSYGATFRNSLPPCRVITPPIAALGEQVAQWLAQAAPST